MGRWEEHKKRIRNAYHGGPCTQALLAVEAQTDARLCLCVVYLAVVEDCPAGQFFLRAWIDARPLVLLFLETVILLKDEEGYAVLRDDALKTLCRLARGLPAQYPAVAAISEPHQEAPGSASIIHNNLVF